MDREHMAENDIDTENVIRETLNKSMYSKFKLLSR